MNMLANILGRGAMAMGYDMGDTSHTRRDLGWGKRNPIDEDAILKDGSRQTIRQKALDQWRNNPVAAGVCDRISSFAIGHTGLRPQAMTSDDAWNTAAEDWWNYQYAPNCDSRGRLSMWRMQWQAVSCRPTMGGLYFQKLSDGTVRPIEPERIRDPQKQENRAGFVDGVKVDPKTGRILGYMIHARDKNGGFGGEHEERFVDAENVIPAIRPAGRPDQVREIPDFASLGNSMQDTHEANQYTLATMKTQSKPVGALTKGGGVGTNSSPRGSAATVTGERQRFQMESLEVMLLNPGETLNMTTSPTPGNNHIAYMQMQYGLQAAGIDYPYEFFTLDFTHCDYSRMKAVLLLINKASRNWQAWASEWLTNWWLWRVAMAMRTGELPEAPVDPKTGRSEWWLVDWQAPEELWIDRQESAQADLLEWQMRQGSLSEFARRRGKDFEDNLRSQARDYKLTRRIEIEEEVPTGTLEPKMQIPGQQDPNAKTIPETTTQKQAAIDAAAKDKADP